MSTVRQEYIRGIQVANDLYTGENPNWQALERTLENTSWLLDGKAAEEWLDSQDMIEEERRKAHQSLDEEIENMSPVGKSVEKTKTGSVIEVTTLENMYRVLTRIGLDHNLLSNVEKLYGRRIQRCLSYHRSGSMHQLGRQLFSTMCLVTSGEEREKLDRFLNKLFGRKDDDPVSAFQQVQKSDNEEKQEACVKSLKFLVTLGKHYQLLPQQRGDVDER